ncbi:regulator of chromosome condensation 1/beta-lactamase-inhibitor protein II [Cytidiella melzeri]|nr:regulator of chromosome condensation 1/beta-lactamase-inhibitor protein II [Cytidiella melzeri]
MPRSPSTTVDSSGTEESCESEEEIPAPPPPKRLPQARATPATKPSKPAEEEASTPARRSTRVASQTIQVAAEPAAPTKKASSRKFAKEPEEGGMNVEDLVDKLDKVKLQGKAKPTKPKLAHQHEGEYLNALPQLAQYDDPSAERGQLFVWGAGNAGQYGMGVDQLGEFKKPRKNTLVEEMMKSGKFGAKGAGIVTLAAGGMSSLFVDEAGTVWSCGANDDAALGRPTKDVPDLKKKNVILDEDELSSNLHPLQSLVDEGFRAVQVAAGDSIGAAISDAGDLRVWGTFRASGGVLGFSGGLTHQVLPIPVLDLKSKPGNVEKFVEVAAGNDHVVVVTTHGNIYTWGVGERGQLGRKVLERHKINGTSPERIVIGKRSTKAILVGAGAYTSFAVDNDLNVWGWGANNCGQTGTGFVNSTDGEVHTPKRVIGLSSIDLGEDDYVTKIAGGDDHTLFLTKSGQVYACGLSISGRLGLSDDDPAFCDRPFPDFLDRPKLLTFPNGDFIADISAGPRTNMAISDTGVLYMWGEGGQSELGSGDEEVLRTPTRVVPKGQWLAMAGSCGGQHTLALFEPEHPTA